MKTSSAKLMLMFVLCGLIVFTMESCKKKCKNENPQARVINNGTSKASVQIKTSNGNTVNINNVDPGTSSAYASYAAGEVTFTITVNSMDYVHTVQMINCYNYDISIDANNNITATPIDRNN